MTLSGMKGKKMQALEEAVKQSEPSKPIAKQVVLIEQIETSKETVKDYLLDAGKDQKCAPEGGKAHKLAVFRYIADSLKIDGELRKQAWKQFQATPNWFGCNASAARQALGIKTSNVFETPEFDA